MSIRTQRSSKRSIAVLTAFGVVASTFAISSSAGAALFDEDVDGPGPGGIRLEPTFTSSAGDGWGTPAAPVAQDQPAPAIPADATSSAAAMQLLVHNQWNAGDRVLVQLFDSEEDNCSSVAEALGFANTAADLDISVSGPFEYDPTEGSPWQTNNGSPDVAGFADDPVDATPASTQPVFTPTLGASSGCAAQGINDVLILSFANTSTPLADIPDPDNEGETLPNPALTDAFVVTIDSVELEVGASVAGGPVIALPVAQDRSNVAANLFLPTENLFSGNSTNFGPFAPGVEDIALSINEWTNPAFIVPVTITSDAPDNLVADGFFQDLGEITLAGTQPGALTEGQYTVCIQPGIGQINVDLLELTTNAAGTTAEVVGTTGNGCIIIDVTAVTGTASVTISGIFGPVNSAGSKSVSLQGAPPAFIAQYLTPNDQDGDGPFTDVNFGTLVPFFQVPHGSASSLPGRIGGNDRFETAAKIAYSTTECARFAVLVNGNSFPDSLSASYLAGALSVTEQGFAPILTTRGNTLSSAAEVAIRELGVRTVYVVGGSAAVSASVEATVDALPRTRCGGAISDTTQTVQVERIAGANRYETNKDVVQRAQSLLDSSSINYNQRIRYQANAGEASARTVLLASGADFADALSAGPISFGNSSRGFPLVLTTPDSLAPTASSTISNLDIERVVIIGGPAAVSTAVEESLESQGLDVIRLQGDNRYMTSAAVLNWASTPLFPGSEDFPGGEGFNLGLGWNPFGTVVLARGDDFADALAVAPFVGSRQDLLVLTTPTSLHPAAAGVITVLTNFRAEFGLGGPPVIAIGLGNAISTSVLEAANAVANA